MMQGYLGINVSMITTANHVNCEPFSRGIGQKKQQASRLPEVDRTLNNLLASEKQQQSSTQPIGAANKTVSNNITDTSNTGERLVG